MLVIIYTIEIDRRHFICQRIRLSFIAHRVAMNHPNGREDALLVGNGIRFRSIFKNLQLQE
jgi:hypothetical protein